MTTDMKGESVEETNSTPFGSESQLRLMRSQIQEQESMMGGGGGGGGVMKKKPTERKQRE